MLDLGKSFLELGSMEAVDDDGDAVACLILAV